MAKWNTGSYQISDISIGAVPNDGQGDTIRDAFSKTRNDFANLSLFLSSSTTDNSTDFTNLKSDYFTGTNTSVTNLFVANALVTNANITANVTAGNLIANSKVYATQGVITSGNIVPSVDSAYDLGSPARYFNNLYIKNTVQLGQTITSDSGMLLVHSSALAGDVKDVGIQGNVSHAYTSGNAYAFFGFQKTTQDFIYKIGPTNWANATSVANDGVYGNAHLGSLFLSNATASSSASTGALIVAGGVGVTGNINLTGNINVSSNIYSGGYQTLTTNMISTLGYPTYTGGNLFLGNTVFASTAISTTANTGAVVILGGLGVGSGANGGNVNVAGNVVASIGLVGPYYGTVQTASQTNITQVGSLLSLNVIGTASAGSLTSTNTAYFYPTSGNGIVVSANVWAGGLVSPSIYGTIMTAAQPNITSTGALSAPSLTVTGNITAGNVSATKGTFTSVQGTLLTAAQPNITSTGALTVPSVTVNGNTAVASTVYAQGVYDNSNRVLSTTAGSGNLTISGTQVTLTTTGPGAATVGSSTAIPVITTDIYGRVSVTSTAAVVAPAGTLTGSTLASGVTASSLTSVGTLTGLTVSGTVQPNANATVNSGGTSNYWNNLYAAAITTNGITVGASGGILPAANVAVNIGSSSLWFNTFYGVSSQAKYADLAERYTSDADYEAGTVVVFGGNKEITTTNEFADVSVAGAISTDPAYLMNAMEEGLPVALRGRVPVKVIGPVQKGDLLVTAGANPGYAISVGKSAEYPLAVFAKAIETNTNEGTKVITAVIL